MKPTNQKNQEPASFRDPSGYVYYQDQQVFRHINASYLPVFTALTKDKFLDELIQQGILLPFKTYKKSSAEVTLQVEPIAFISYPYEWSFGQLKDAALTTLKLQEWALKAGFTLKDANAFNIQFHQGRPVFIDHLSFELYQPSEPWVAYRQFCEHFLAPLALMAHTDIRLNQLLRIHPHGIPLDLTVKLLPKKTLLSLTLATHLHLHARNQSNFAAARQKTQNKKQLPKSNLTAIINNLYDYLTNLTAQSRTTEWADYYQHTNYNQTAFSHKKTLIKQYLSQANPSTVWDLGANDAQFSRLASQQGITTIAFDIDPNAVNKAYLQARSNQDIHLLPLIMDLTNPSPGLGWNHTERMSLKQRGPSDLTMALALVHHLAISNNVPLQSIAYFLKCTAPHLIIEFIPKKDSQVQKLLATREDIFKKYTQVGFETAFQKHFTIKQKNPIKSSDRSLYLMEVK